MKKFQWLRVPVLEPINMWTIHEHPPLNPYKGEYPRFIRPPYPPAARWEWKRIEVFATPTRDIQVTPQESEQVSSRLCAD